MGMVALMAAVASTTTTSHYLFFDVNLALLA